MDGNVRSLQKLNDLGLEEWTLEELKVHRGIMSDLSPWLNAQGISMQHRIVEELEKRSGL